MNKIEIIGTNDEEKMKQIRISTSLTIFQNTLEYNYNKSYLNRRFSKMKIYTYIYMDLQN